MAQSIISALLLMLTFLGQASATPSAMFFESFTHFDAFGALLKDIVAFGLISIAAWPLGAMFPKYLRVPLITGYLVIGILAGPYVSNCINEDSVHRLGPIVLRFALSFIAFQAGQEIYLPSMKMQLWSINQQMIGVMVATMLIVTGAVYFFSPIFFFAGEDNQCRASIASLFGAISIARSPASALAVVSQVRAQGQFTNLLLGITMMSDIMVLLVFSVVRIGALTACGSDEADGSPLSTVFISFAVILVDIVIGLCFGYVIIAVLSTPDLHPRLRALSSTYVKGALWLFSGFTFFLFSDWVYQVTVENFGSEKAIAMEPLLVCMIASCLAGHREELRKDAHVILDATAPFIFLPFFSMTGAALHIDKVLTTLHVSIFVVLSRLGAIFVGSYVSGKYIAKLPETSYKYLWLTLQSQAGVALGLANEVGSHVEEAWGQSFASAVTSVVIINQVIGPILCLVGLRKSGEAQEPVFVKPWRAKEAVVVGGGHVVGAVVKHLTAIGIHVTICKVPSISQDEWEVLCEDLGATETSVRVASHLLDDSPDPKKKRKLTKEPILREEQQESGEIDAALDRRAAITKETDVVIFTIGGEESSKVTRNIKKVFGSKCPRLIAVVEDQELATELLSEEVLVIHPQVSISHVVTQLALVSREHARDIAVHGWDASRFVLELGLGGQQSAEEAGADGQSRTSRPSLDSAHENAMMEQELTLRPFSSASAMSTTPSNARAFLRADHLLKSSRSKAAPLQETNGRVQAAPVTSSVSLAPRALVVPPIPERPDRHYGPSATSYDTVPTAESATSAASPTRRRSSSIDDEVQLQPNGGVLLAAQRAAYGFQQL